MSAISILARITRRRPHIRLHARAHNPWVSIVGSNGRIMLVSETYSSLAAARRAATALAKDTGWVVRDVKA